MGVVWVVVVVVAMWQALPWSLVECIFWILRLYFPVSGLYLPISRYLSISSHFAAYPLYPTVSHCIHSISLISHYHYNYIQLYLRYLLYPAVCLTLYLTVSHRFENGI